MALNFLQFNIYFTS